MTPAVASAHAIAARVAVDLADGMLALVDVLELEESLITLADYGDHLLDVDPEQDDAAELADRVAGMRLLVELLADVRAIAPLDFDP